MHLRQARVTSDTFDGATFRPIHSILNIRPLAFLLLPVPWHEEIPHEAKRIVRNSQVRLVPMRLHNPSPRKLGSITNLRRLSSDADDDSFVASSAVPLCHHSP